MTLSMSQGINTNSISSSGVATNTSRTSPVSQDFSTIFQLLLSTSMNPYGNSDSGSGLQTLLLSLAPYLQNISTLNASAAAPSGIPVSGNLTQDYHGAHQGLDFGIEVGTPIKSTMSGVVKYAGWNDEGYGNLVIVDNGAYQTYYAHLSSIPVQVGQSVQAGQIIGLSGNTGNSTGPHLHYEIRAEGKQINPKAYTYGKAAEYII